MRSINTEGSQYIGRAPWFSVQRGLRLRFRESHGLKNNSERPIDALAIKKVTHSLTDNFKSRDASASKKNKRTSLRSTAIEFLMLI